VRKLQKQLNVYLTRAGVDPSRIAEAVETFEARFKDFHGLEFLATDENGNYIELNNEKLNPEKYIELIKSGSIGSPEEKKYFTSFFVNEAIRSSRGAIETETGDMNERLRRAAGFKDESD
jgi:hypothetical protein